jgi:Cd2+/Zn2+-exporting ATPase
MKTRVSLLGADAWLLSLPVRLSTALVAGVALLLGLLMSRLRPGNPELATLGFFAAWLVISVPVLVGAARGLFHQAKELNPYYLDQFVAIVLLACLADGRYATGAIVSIILIFGQLLEERSVRGIREAIDGLSRLSRISARRLRGEAEEAADADTLAVGDRLRVLPGELIPADGRVLRGQSAVNQAAVTGESMPVDVGPGDEVFAGTLNLSGVIELETTRVATETVIGRVRSILEAAPADKPLIARRIDAYLRYYTPVVLMLTAMTWILTKDLSRAVSVLVVCLPCAFVLSGPSVMVAGLAVCARLGILVKTPRHFETATTLDAVVFDKTGTLTRGHLAVELVETYDEFSLAETLPLARRLAAASQHPVARAIAGHFGETGGTGGTPSARDSGPAVERVEEVAGRGLRGRVDGVEVMIGSAVWLRENGLAFDTPPEVEGRRTVFLVLDRRLALRFGLTDTVRPESREVVAALAAAGLDRTMLLTGDHALAAASIAQATGIAQFRAGCLPEEKLDEVRALKREGRRVLVVGDGVNDAPALAGGDLGVAINHSGGHIAVQTADVALLQDNLRGLVHFVQISHRALRLINQNLLVATLIIVVSLLLSALGIVGPLTAALLHETSAFFVLINSARLLRFQG